MLSAELSLVENIQRLSIVLGVPCGAAETATGFIVVHTNSSSVSALRSGVFPDYFLILPGTPDNPYTEPIMVCEGLQRRSIVLSFLLPGTL